MGKIFADTWQIFMLYAIQMRALVWFYLMAALVIPIMTYFFVGAIGSSGGLSSVTYLGGSIVMSLSLTTVTFLAQVILGDRLAGRLKLFITSPVSPASYVLGLLTFSGLKAFINVAILIVLGALMGLALHLNAWLIPMVILTVMSMTGISLLISTLAKEPQVGTALASTLGALSVIVCPVFYPIEHLPETARWIVYLLPATYSAHGIQTLLKGGNDFYGDLLGLLAFTVIVFGLGVKKMNWREQ